MTREHTAALAALIGSYLAEHDPAADPDPAATQNMVRQCQQLHADLAELLRLREPAPATEPLPPLELTALDFPLTPSGA